MPVLRRADGVVFVLQPYRELLKLKSTTIVKRELSLLAQNYGVYSRMFKLSENRLEAVFTRDPGYLFGETVWHYFDKPRDLLYCEALEDSDEILVVVVRDGNVYLDAKMSRKNFVEELTLLQSSAANFAVYVCGDVPLAETAIGDDFVLDTGRVQSFTRLNNSVFAELPARAEMALLLIERAIGELKLNQRAYQVSLTLLVLIVLSMFWLWYTSQPAVVPGVQQNTGVSPYQQYVNSLQTPDPKAQLNELAQQMNVVYSLPGWLPTQVNYNSGGARIDLHSLGGSISGLLQWAAARNLRITLSSDGAQLALPSTLTARAAPQGISDSQQNIALLVDRMMAIIPNKSVQVGTVTPHGIYNETGINIMLNNVSPDVLVLVGRALAGLPVTMPNCTLSLANGLLSGTLQLTLLGN